MVQALEHVTITTGATRMSPRSEVAQALIEQLARGLHDVPAGGDLSTGVGEWVVRIVERQPEGYCYDLLDGPRALVRCFLCLLPAGTVPMWEAAESYALDKRVRLARPKAAPWLAAAGLPDLLTSAPERIGESGDLARVVAWALIEDHHG